MADCLKPAWGAATRCLDRSPGELGNISAIALSRKFDFFTFEFRELEMLLDNERLERRLASAKTPRLHEVSGCPTNHRTKPFPASMSTFRQSPQSMDCTIKEPINLQFEAFMADE